MINPEKIYFVGLSDGQSNDKTHYICMWDESEKVTSDWCKSVKDKFGSNTVMIKLNGKKLRTYLDIPSAQ